MLKSQKIIKPSGITCIRYAQKSKDYKALWNNLYQVCSKSKDYKSFWNNLYQVGLKSKDYKAF
jgi:hypothetical protein